MNSKFCVKFVTDRQTDRQTDYNSVIFLLQFINSIFYLYKKYILHLVNPILTLYNLSGNISRLFINKKINIFIKGV